MKLCACTKTTPDKALFLLRLSLGGFFLIWALDKILNTRHAYQVISNFYKLNLVADDIYVLGGMQILLSLVFIAGVYKFWSYGAVLLLHTVSVASTWRQLLDPFEDNMLFLAGVPVWFAYLALFLLRDHDTFMTLKSDKTKYFSDDGTQKVE